MEIWSASTRTHSAAYRIHRNFHGEIVLCVQATPKKFAATKIWLSQPNMASEFRKKLCVRGYHVYNDMWEVAVGETLVCVGELRDALDKTQWPSKRMAQSSGTFKGVVFVLC